MLSSPTFRPRAKGLFRLAAALLVVGSLAALLFYGPARAMRLVTTTLQQKQPQPKQPPPAVNPVAGDAGQQRGISPASLQANGQIAFVSDRDGNSEIYRMNPDGTGPIRLTNNAVVDVQPAFSPDGSKIVFASDRDGNRELYIMNADGTGQTRLTTDSAADEDPAFSPDGSKIVFDSERDGNIEIYLMNADGTGQTNLTNNAGFDSGASFSPDGSKIVFASDRDGNDEIYRMNPDGTGQTRITNTPANELRPVFSPDGSKIVVWSFVGADNEIYLMNADGTGLTNLTNNPAIDAEPAFSPDGSKIIFRSDRDGNDEIYQMNPNGTGQTNLSNSLASEFAPAWQTLLSCTPPAANGVAWYRAEGNANDSLGTNNGTPQNGATFAPGFVGQAFSFDGVDDRIDVPASAALDLTVFTVEAWIKPNSVGTTSIIVDKEVAGSINYYLALLTDNKVQIDFFDGQHRSVDSDVACQAGSWCHVAGTYDGATLKVYVNGTPAGSLSYAGTPPVGQPLYIGRRFNNTFPFNGLIDEVDIYGRALSDAEVKNIYDAKNAGKCLALPTQTITASNTNDSGPGSLRQAILDANASPGTQTIDFNIPGAGVHTISLTSALPDITEAVIIDGYTQPGSSVNTLVAGDNAVLQIELNGAGAGSVSGLRLVGNGSTVRGLVINRFSGDGIVLAGTDNSIISGNFIGTDATGLTDLGNGSIGVEGEFGSNANNNLIGGTTPAARNVISGNGSSGVEFNFATGNIIQGNFIGLAANGTTALGNSGSGVAVGAFTSNHLIGGDDDDDGTTDGVVNARNYISGNGGSGIFNGGAGSGNSTIQGNHIGTDVTGTLARANANGIDTNIANNTIVGGTTFGAGNLISGNTNQGIAVSFTTGMIIQSNRIGTQSDGLTALGNGGNGIFCNAGRPIRRSAARTRATSSPSTAATASKWTPVRATRSCRTRSTRTAQPPTTSASTSAQTV